VFVFDAAEWGVMRLLMMMSTRLLILGCYQLAGVAPAAQQFVLVILLAFNGCVTTDAACDR
jgi:hypothetical protein